MLNLVPADFYFCCQEQRVKFVHVYESHKSSISRCLFHKPYMWHVLIHKYIKFSRNPRPPQFSSGSQSPPPSKNPPPRITRQKICQIFCTVNSLAVQTEYTSNMAAWFCAQFNGSMTSLHLIYKYLLTKLGSSSITSRHTASTALILVPFLERPK